MAFGYILAAVCTLVYVLYTQIVKRYKYWEQRGVKSPQTTFLVGNFKTIFQRVDSINTLTARYYKQYPNEKVIGIYQGLIPSLIVKDPKLIKNVLIKDFSSFTDRGIRISNEGLSKNMFSEEGDNWRILRQNLSPIFTTGKLKSMMPLLNDCVDQYVMYIKTIVDGDMPCEIRAINTKYTLKAIASVAFGIDVDTFAEEKNTFIIMARKLFEPNPKRRYAIILNSIIPGIVTKLNIKVGKPEVAEFFFSLIREIVNEREGKPKTRRDFMDLMIEMKERGTISKVNEDGVTEFQMDEVIMAAQAVIFYAAGFETSSSTMTFLLYELAMNRDIQERCNVEIDRIMKKYDGELTYESLNELQYLSMVFDETLRKHPVAGILFRQCVHDCEFKDMNLTIEKGTKIFIPVPAIHYDPKYYPEPEKFNPDRFAPENKHNLVDGAYLPFGDGPRNCIGLRFARVQSMLGIAHFLHRFRVTPSDRTPTRIRYNPQQPVLSSLDGVWLHVTRR